MVTWAFSQWLWIPIAPVSILTLTWIVSLIIRTVGKRLDTQNDQDTHKTNFWDIIRDGDYYPSLARFQFLLWTFNISFAFLSVYLVRVFGGVGWTPRTNSDWHP